jgi:hypothetical protein
VVSKKEKRWRDAQLLELWDKPSQMTATDTTGNEEEGDEDDSKL